MDLCSDFHGEDDDVDHFSEFPDQFAFFEVFKLLDKFVLKVESAFESHVFFCFFEVFILMEILDVVFSFLLPVNIMALEDLGVNFKPKQLTHFLLPILILALNKDIYQERY